MAKSAVIAYGDALFRLALEDGKLEERKNEVIWVQKVLEENKEFIRFLDYPQISKKRKVNTAECILENHISKDFMGLFLLLIRKGRNREIQEILVYFLEREREYRKVGMGSVLSAILLTDKQKKQIEEKLLDITDYKTISLQYIVDKSLIGGLIVQIGNKIVDNSIRGRLDRMTEELIKR